MEMNRYIIIGRKKTAILYNNKSVEQILNIHSTYNIGDIYLGQVVNILSNLNVAFIKLNKWEQNGFMILKNESYLNNNPRLGEDIVVQVMKEPISRKGPTVTRDIILENENIKIHSYNRNNIVFGKTFNFSDKQYLRTITTLVKPKKIGIEIEKKEKKINIWEIVKNLRKLEKKSLLIEKKIRKIHNSPCLISPKQGIIEIILKKN